VRAEAREKKRRQREMLLKQEGRAGAGPREGVETGRAERARPSGAGGLCGVRQQRPSPRRVRGARGRVQWC
jgi:hypothetical protein